MKWFLLGIVFVGGIQASEPVEPLTFGDLPPELQCYTLTFLGEGRTADEAFKEVLALRRVSSAFNAMLSDPIVLQRLLHKTNIESICTSLVLRDGLPFGTDSVLFLVGIDDHHIQMWACLFVIEPNTFGRVPESLLSFVRNQYTVAEIETLKAYLVKVLCWETMGGVKYYKALLTRLWSKGQLVDYLVSEMKQFYQLQRIDYTAYFEAMYGYCSLEGRSASEELIQSRFEKFKLVVPFFIEMCTRKFITQDFRELLRIQIKDFAGVLTKHSDKNELAQVCTELSEAIFSKGDKIQWEETAQELLKPKQKRVKV